VAPKRPRPCGGVAAARQIRACAGSRAGRWAARARGVERAVACRGCSEAGFARVGRAQGGAAREGGVGAQGASEALRSP